MNTVKLGHGISGEVLAPHIVSPKWSILPFVKLPNSLVAGRFSMTGIVGSS